MLQWPRNPDSQSQESASAGDWQPPGKVSDACHDWASLSAEYAKENSGTAQWSSLPIKGLKGK